MTNESGRGAGRGRGRRHARLEWRDDETEDRLLVDVVGDEGFLDDLVALGFFPSSDGDAPRPGAEGPVRFAALERLSEGGDVPARHGSLCPRPGGPRRAADDENNEGRGEVRRKGA